MKKALLFTALGSIAFGISAQTAPTQLDNFYVSGISRNGRYLTSHTINETSLYDLENSKIIYSIENDDVKSYSLGNGNHISDNGIALIGDDSKSWLVIDGEVVKPASLEKFPYSSLNGITPDGKTLCGLVTNFDVVQGSDSNTNYLPAVFILDENNVLSEPEYLPYPELDFLGKKIQHASANAISDDGKTIIGQVIDWSGFVIYPIVYTKGNDGKWSYSLPTEQYLNPDKLVLPEDPGTAKDITEFMSPDEKAEFEAAYKKWQEETPYDWATMPNATDFMTPEEIAAYNAYAEDFNEKLTNYYMVRDEIFRASLSFEQNNVAISPDGKTATMAAIIVTENPDPMAWDPFIELNVPYTFDLVDGTATPVSFSESLSPTSITNEGTLFCGTALKMGDLLPVRGFVRVAGENEMISLESFVERTNPEWSKWMAENLTYPVEVDYDPETFEPITQDVLFSGRPYCNGDGTTVATAIENYYAPVPYITIVFDDVKTGISNVAVGSETDVTVSALRGGVLLVGGEAASLTVYDLGGRAMFCADAPEGAITTGLSAGVYVVKAVAANGTAVTTKVAF